MGKDIKFYISKNGVRRFWMVLVGSLYQSSQPVEFRVF